MGREYGHNIIDIGIVGRNNAFKRVQTQGVLKIAGAQVALQCARNQLPQGCEDNQHNNQCGNSRNSGGRCHDNLGARHAHTPDAVECIFLYEIEAVASRIPIAGGRWAFSFHIQEQR